jgi:hypothetical protein
MHSKSSLGTAPNIHPFSTAENLSLIAIAHNSYKRKGKMQIKHTHAMHSSSPRTPQAKENSCLENPNKNARPMLVSDHSMSARTTNYAK